MSNRVVRRLLLLGVPLAAAVLGTTHVSPLQPTAFQALAESADWWLALHLIQLPLFGLLGLAIYQLTAGLTGPLVSVSRGALAVFAVFYSAFDAAMGIGTGVLVRYARELSASDQLAVESALEFLGDNLTLDVVAAIGAIAWIVAGLGAVLALARTGAPRLPLALIGLGVLVFGVSHAPPVGPAGLAILLAGTTLLEFRAPQRAPRSAFARA